MRKISSYLNTNLKPSLDKYMLLSLFILLVWVFYPTLPATASSTDNVSGYAWSETVGWISFNCIDNDSCASSNYGVNIDFATGNLSGYAWSEHIGWISFERATTNNPPQDPFNTGSGPIARYNSGTGMLEGWARALSGCENTPGTPLSPCPQTSAGGASGGFDGWIKLSGVATNGSSYGVSVSSSGDSSGFAWGSEVVGWVDFNMVNVTMPGTPSVILEANPNPVSSTPSPVTLTWTVANVTNCTASNNGGVVAWNGSKNSINGVHPESVTVNSTPVTFVLTCLDSFGEPITDSVTVNRIGVPSVTLTASPSTINTNDSTTLNWSTEDMTNCTASGAWSGSKPVNASFSESTGPLTADSTFTLNCVDTSGLPHSKSVTVTVNSSLPVPTGTISAGLCEILAGQSTCNSTVTWSTTNATNPEVYQGSNPFSTFPSGSQDGSVSYGSNTFYLRDGSTDLGDVTVNAGCAGGSTWNGSACVATPPPPPPPPPIIINIEANPNIIRSGNTAKVEYSITSNTALVCKLNGGIDPIDSTINYNNSNLNNELTDEVDTLELASTQMVELKCYDSTDTSFSIPLGEVKTRITVIPTVQEI